MSRKFQEASKILTKCKLITIFPLISPSCLFNFESLRCGAYWREAFKRGRHFFQSKNNCSHEISKFCNLLCSLKYSRVPELLSFFIDFILILYAFCLFIYLFLFLKCILYRKTIVRFLISIGCWGAVLVSGRRLLKGSAYSDMSVHVAALIREQQLL